MSFTKGEKTVITRREARKAQRRAARLLRKAGVKLTGDEKKHIEIVEFGLGELETTGYQQLMYANTERYCAKELVLFPGQTCPEHRHPPVGADPGRRKTLRCRYGRVYLYVEGERTKKPKCKPNKDNARFFTVFCEIELKAGEQYSVPPDTKHWFQAGDKGAVISEFSSTSRDEADDYTDPRIDRMTKIIED